MPDSAKVIVEGSTLRVLAPQKSTIFSGKNYIYFVNLLGLEPLEAPEYGYQITLGASRHAIILQIVEYLQRNGFSIELQGAAYDLVQRLKGEADSLAAARAVGSLLKDQKKKPDPAIVPNFIRKLKPYQQYAVQHAVSVGNAANFSVPGSGKTTMALAAYAILKAKGQIDRLIVIGPRACFMPWEEEFEACMGRIPLSIRISGPRLRRKDLYREADDAELVLLSYQMASNDAEDLAALLKRSKCMLVLDESHNVKRIEGGRWSDTVIGLAPFAARRLILSGTPAPNSLLDLWSQFTFLWPNPPVLGKKDSYRYKVEEGSDKVGLIKNTIYPLFWRVKKSDLHLPDPIFHKIEIEMRVYQRRIYEAIGTKVLKEVVRAPTERDKLRIWRKAKLIRLLQTASNPSLLSEYSSEFQIPPLDASDLAVDQIIENYSKYEIPSKLECAEKLARQLVQRGLKAIIWSTFVHNIKTLESLLVDLKPLSIFGAVPKDDQEDEEYNRERIIREFKTSDASTILIANPGACAESVSLHKVCRHAIYVDRTFNGAQYIQSLDRIHRVGLGPRDRVHYYLLEAKDSVDVVVDSRLELKKNRMLALLEDDIPVINLDTPAEELSDEGDDEADFEAVVDELKKEFGVKEHGR